MSKIMSMTPAQLADYKASIQAKATPTQRDLRHLDRIARREVALGLAPAPVAEVPMVDVGFTRRAVLPVQSDHPSFPGCKLTMCPPALAHGSEAGLGTRLHVIALRKEWARENS
jgi:hypothetical protein